MSQPSGPLIPDSVALVVPITLLGAAAGIDLTNAVVGDPTLERTIDGATTLSLDVLDWDRSLVRAHRAGRSWAIVDGLTFDLVSLKRTGDVVSLVFEDAVVAALRRRTAPRVFPAGSASRAQIATALGAEAGVTVLVDPPWTEKVADAVTRNADADGTSSAASSLGSASKDTSWSLMSSLAGGRDGRCFSTGTQVLLGGDPWLMSRTPAVSIAEFTGAVDTIDFELDVQQETSTAEVAVDADRWSLPPGIPLAVTDPGPHTGAWLLTKFTRPLHATRGALSLERGRASLAEPPPSGGDAAGEAGELDFLADSLPLTGIGSGTGRVSARAVEAAMTGPLGKFMTFARAQQGKKYVWGASGPNSFDCSGLVQQSCYAGGMRLSKPCSSQLAQCQRGAGRMITVKEALSTYGALLFRVNFPGSGDHVAISLGDGNTTVEARGEAQGCGVFGNAAARRWTHGAVLDFNSVTYSVGRRSTGAV